MAPRSHFDRFIRTIHLHQLISKGRRHSDVLNVAESVIASKWRHHRQ